MSVRLNEPGFYNVCDFIIDGIVYAPFNDRYVRAIDLRSGGIIAQSPAWANNLRNSSALDPATGYLYYLDAVTNRFVRVHKYNLAGGLANYGVAHPEITLAKTSCYDPTTGQIFLGSPQAEMFRYNVTTDTVTSLGTWTTDLSSTYIDNSGQMWGMNGTQLYRVDKYTGATIPITVAALPGNGMAVDNEHEVGIVGLVNGVGAWFATHRDLSDQQYIFQSANIGEAGTIEVSDITVSSIPYIKRVAQGKCGPASEVCNLDLHGKPYTPLGLPVACSHDTQVIVNKEQPATLYTDNTITIVENTNTANQNYAASAAQTLLQLVIPEDGFYDLDLQATMYPLLPGRGTMHLRVNGVVQTDVSSNAFSHPNSGSVNVAQRSRRVTKAMQLSVGDVIELVISSNVAFSLLANNILGISAHIRARRIS